MHPYCYPCSYRLHRSRPPAQLPRHHLEVGAALPTLRGEGDFVAFLPGSGKRNLSPGGGTSRWDPLSHHQCKLPRCLRDPPLHVFPSFLRDPDPSLFMLGTPQALDNPYLLRHQSRGGSLVVPIAFPCLFFFSLAKEITQSSDDARYARTDSYPEGSGVHSGKAHIPSQQDVAATQHRQRGHGTVNDAGTARGGRRRAGRRGVLSHGAVRDNRDGGGTAHGAADANWTRLGYSPARVS